MVHGIILIEGDNIRESIGGIGLSNAKQLIIGEAQGFGFLLHIAANTSDDFNKALTEFAKIPEVTVTTLKLISSL